MSPVQRSGKENRGFTIIEILVVVAVLAILAGISIPQYQRMVNKGNQQGAVAALTSVYMAEKNFAAENHTYTACISAIGVAAPPASAKNWYTYGFYGTTLGANCGPSGGYNCNVDAWDEGAAVATCTTGSVGTDFFNANVEGDPAASMPTGANLGTLATDMSNTTFTARAVGNLSSKSNYDRWMIDSTGQTVNTVNNL
jgi:prepilin-type N-terminal cleavage/methylation domain-containing protein